MTEGVAKIAEEKPQPTKGQVRPGFDINTGTQTWCIVEGDFHVSEDGRIRVSDAVFSPATNYRPPVEKEEPQQTSEITVWTRGLMKALLVGLKEAARVLLEDEDKRTQGETVPWTEKEKDYVEGETTPAAEEE